MRLPFSYSFCPAPCGVWTYRLQRYGFSIKNTPFFYYNFTLPLQNNDMSKGKTFARRHLGERGCAPLGTANTTDGGGWRERSHRNRFLTVKAALTRAERKSV